MFPIIYYNSYSYLINHLNLITTKKLPKTKIFLTKKNLTLIKALHSIGCINKFLVITSRKHKNKNPRIYLSTQFYKNVPFFKSVRVVSTPSKHHVISLKALKLVSYSLGSSVILLSTSCGIVSHREALRLRVGGRIICITH